MKVRVNVIVAAMEKEAMGDNLRDLNMVVGDDETAGSLKERLAEAEAVPFPSQCLKLGGQVIADERLLSDCGVKDGDALDFVIQASAETFTAQLAQLLKLRDVSCDELGLMYSYKFGAGINEALGLLGHQGSLSDFLAKRPGAGIAVSNGVASLPRDRTGLRTFSVAEEAERLLMQTSTGSMEIKELCIRFANKFGVSLTSVAGVRPADFFAREHSLFSVPSPGYVCLKGKKFQAAAAEAKPVPYAVPVMEDLGDTPPGMDMPPGLALPPGLDANAPAFKPAASAGGLDANAPAFQPAAAHAPKRPECKWKADSDQGDTKYMELHDRICTRSAEGAIQALDKVIDVLQEAAFLNVDRVGRGGSLAKGTAISTPAGIDAEVVLFLRALPAKSQDRWMPPLIRAAAGVLAEKLEGEHGIEAIRSTPDSVRFRVSSVECVSPLMVDLRFSPAFGSYSEAAQALASVNGPDTRRFFSASFVNERVNFVSCQPDSVKATIRLLKWWRDQQNWSSHFAHPSDEILEVLASYSAVHMKPSDQRTAVANVMALCARFSELRVVWSDVYSKGDVWKPLLKHRPLLMDPVNPYVNLADLQAFESRELMLAAKTTHFFW